MSLDVYLYAEHPVAPLPPLGSGIFIREDGEQKEISRKEWDRRYLDRDPVLCTQDRESNELYHRNITHNLGRMAKAAGLYGVIWHPDVSGIKTAGQLAHSLDIGLEALISNPEYFSTFNPENRWGDYLGLVRFVTDYRNACIRYHDARVEVSR